MKQLFTLSILVCLCLCACKMHRKHRAARHSQTTTAHKKHKKNKKHKNHYALTGTHWSLYELEGKPQPPGEKDIYILLRDKKSKLEGFAGCNGLGGNYKESKHGAIQFEAFSTKMACDDIQRETTFTHALEVANRYVINERHLLLYADTRLLAVLEAKDDM